jgi:hypothetical protein
MFNLLLEAQVSQQVPQAVLASVLVRLVFLVLRVVLIWVDRHIQLVPNTWEGLHIRRESHIFEARHRTMVLALT